MTDTADQAYDVASGVPRSPLGWAAYLGASWTWCIGMFLPVLLVRDYGPWAWVIFAVPNCVGAAAMGWLMPTAAASRAYVVRHAAACRLFGLVTIAFQLFFATWVLPRLVGPAGYVGTVVLIRLAFTPVLRPRRQVVGGAAVLLVSAVVAAALAARGALVWPPPAPLRPADAVGLALVCGVGFLTCPYLDLTFHRARRSTDGSDAKVAFGVGFCVFFAAMIVLTFFYATNFVGLGGGAAVLLAVHLGLQMAYTVNLHAAELRAQAVARDDVGVARAALGVALAVGLAAGLAAHFGAGNHLAYRSHDVGELCYRGFLGFYGLLFPAYVLLSAGRPRVSTAAWLAVATAGLPFFWLAFLEARMPWGIAGAAVVVGGAVMVRAVTPPAPTPPTG